VSLENPALMPIVDESRYLLELIRTRGVCNRVCADELRTCPLLTFGRDRSTKPCPIYTELDYNMSDTCFPSNVVTASRRMLVGRYL